MEPKENLSREGAIGELAKVLHWKMEHLDPTEKPDWENLTDREREFYRLCVQAIFNEGDLCRLAAKR